MGKVWIYELKNVNLFIKSYFQNNFHSVQVVFLNEKHWSKCLSVNLHYSSPGKNAELLPGPKEMLSQR